jgi:hypothetical protein
MAITFSNGVIIGATLGTLTNPAISAVQLYNAGIRTNGWYWIKTGMMNQPRLVYCNMVDNGGGWMLVSYNPSGSAAGQVGYHYPNNWVSGSGTFNKLAANAEELWYSVSGSAQATSVMRMASTASVQPHLSNVSIAHQVTYTNPNALDLASGSISATYTLKLSAPLTGSWTPIKGYTIMTGSLPVATPPDWLYDTANWWTVVGPTSAYPDSPNGRSGNAQGTGGWTNRTSNQIYGLANVSTTGNGLVSNFNTLAVYIK